MKFSEQLHATVLLRPLLVRPEQAALLLGSGEVVTDFTHAGWLAPVLSEHRLVLYAYRHLESCVRRLETGEHPASSNGTGSCRMPKGERVASDASFQHQARGIINAKPFLLRPDEASLYVGSNALLNEFRQAGWIRPLYERHRLVLFSVRQFEGCAGRLEAGDKPGTYAESDSKPIKLEVSVIAQSVISPVFTRKARRTRRPMPAVA